MLPALLSWAVRARGGTSQMIPGALHALGVWRGWGIREIVTTPPDVVGKELGRNVFARWPLPMQAVTSARQHSLMVVLASRLGTLKNCHPSEYAQWQKTFASMLERNRDVFTPEDFKESENRMQMLQDLVDTRAEAYPPGDLLTSLCEGPPQGTCDSPGTLLDWKTGVLTAYEQWWKDKAGIVTGTAFGERKSRLMKLVKLSLPELEESEDLDTRTKDLCRSLHALHMESVIGSPPPPSPQSPGKLQAWHYYMSASDAIQKRDENPFRSKLVWYPDRYPNIEYSWNEQFDWDGALEEHRRALSEFTKSPTIASLAQALHRAKGGQRFVVDSEELTEIMTLAHSMNDQYIESTGLSFIPPSEGPKTSSTALMEREKNTEQKEEVEYTTLAEEDTLPAQLESMGASLLPYEIEEPVQKAIALVYLDGLWRLHTERASAAELERYNEFWRVSVLPTGLVLLNHLVYSATPFTPPPALTGGRKPTREWICHAAFVEAAKELIDPKNPIHAIFPYMDPMKFLVHFNMAFDKRRGPRTEYITDMILQHVDECEDVIDSYKVFFTRMGVPQLVDVLKDDVKQTREAMSESLSPFRDFQKYIDAKLEPLFKELEKPRKHADQNLDELKNHFPPGLGSALIMGGKKASEEVVPQDWVFQAKKKAFKQIQRMCNDAYEQEEEATQLQNWLLHQKLKLDAEDEASGGGSDPNYFLDKYPNLEKKLDEMVNHPEVFELEDGYDTDVYRAFYGESSLKEVTEPDLTKWLEQWGLAELRKWEEKELKPGDWRLLADEFEKVSKFEDPYDYYEYTQLKERLKEGAEGV